MKVQGTLSRYSQDLNQPLPVIGRHPLYISLVSGASVFEFTWVLRCCCVVCAAGGDAFSFGHGGVKIFTVFWGLQERAALAMIFRSSGLVGSGDHRTTPGGVEEFVLKGSGIFVAVYG